MLSAEEQHKRIALKECNWFRDLGDDVLLYLVKIARLKRVEPKTVILHKGEAAHSLFVLIKGSVALTTVTDDNRELFVGVVACGEVFGEIALLDGGTRTASVTALEACELLVIERGQFLSFARQFPDAVLTILAMTAGRLRQNHQRLEDMAVKQLAPRLAKKLLSLAETFGENTTEGIQFRIKLSQQELGWMSGASRESINKQLKVWEEQYWVAFSKGYLILKNTTAMAQLVESEC